MRKEVYEAAKKGKLKLPQGQPISSQAQSLSHQRNPKGAQVRQITREILAEGKKVGRNSKCPCGSGKKFKRCCGKV